MSYRRRRPGQWWPRLMFALTLTAAIVVLALAFVEMALL